MKITAGLLLTAALTACGAPAQDLDAAQEAARSFVAAYAAGDGEAACAWVAPGTRRTLEEDERRPCAQAVLAADVPELGTVERTQVFSGQAVVVTSEQVLFVSEFDLGWRVTAAGCTPHGDQPHDCEVEGP